MDIKGNTMKPTYSFKAKTSRYSLISFPIEKCIYCAAVLIFLWVISSPSSAQTLTKGVRIENTSAIFVESTKRSALPIAERIKQLKEKKNPVALSKVKFEAFDEGKVAQIMHVGPFSEEGPTVQKVPAFIESNKEKLTGKHHEIYLSDIRKASPEKWKTIIRQPMTKRI